MPKGDDNTYRLQTLFEKYLQNDCSAAELIEFWDQLANLEEPRALDPVLQELWQSIHPDYQVTTHPSAVIQQKAAKLIERSRQDLQDPPQLPATSQKKQKKLRWMAAAALLLLALGLSAYLWLGVKNNTPVQTLHFDAKNGVAIPVYPKDRPTLILANGKTIDLDQLAEGEMVNSTGNGVKIQKTGNGQVTYDFHQSQNFQNNVGDAAGAGALSALNCLITPNGKQFQVVLADGTRVWLNGMSSIQFPIHFNGQQREVNLTGEAYFEVTHRTKQPFIVHTKGMDIQVLGTHFNVNAYSDEPSTRTTLLEGLVQVDPTKKPTNKYTQPQDHQSMILHPGQQFKLSATGKSSLLRSVDIDAVMSWKQGKFIFQKENLGAIMRSIARWYDIKVQYEGNVIPAGHVSGEIARSESLEQVLKMLELAESARFEIQGKTVLVRQVHSIE